MNNSGNNQVNNGQVNAASNKGSQTARSVNSQRKPNNGPAYLTENWLPITGISNGMMTNNRGEKITGIKIQPRNIFILDANSQSNVLNQLQTFYNMLDFEFWLVIADKPVDITVYLSNMQILYNECQNQAVRKLILQDIEKGNMFMNNDVVDTEYFVLFKEKNLDLLQKKIRMMINALAGSGLIASQTSNEDLRTILDNFLNGGRRFTARTVMPQ